MSDDVVDRARTGDPSAWAELYRRHGGRLVLWLGTRPTGDTAVTADDIAAEAWLVAAGKVAEFTGDVDDFGGWIFGIARKIAANHVRRGQRRATSPDPLDDGRLDAGRPGLETQIPGLDWVRSVLAQLPERERQVVGCLDVVGLDIATTARALEMTQVAVRVARHRGLKKLRAQFGSAATSESPVAVGEVDRLVVGVVGAVVVERAEECAVGEVGAAVV